jgi:hypothetical protein
MGDQRSTLVIRKFTQLKERLDACCCLRNTLKYLFYVSIEIGRISVAESMSHYDYHLLGDDAVWLL